MIRAIGIDAVDIDRFDKWVDFSPHRLNRIFSNEEIEYCTKNKAKTAERLAARFATKEAFYKAYCAANLHTPPAFLTFCKLVAVYNAPNPRLAIGWDALLSPTQLAGLKLKTHLSITHTAKSAIAVVIIED